MSRAFDQLQRRVRSERGATMVEYGLMVVLIATVVVAAVSPVGTAVSAFFTGVPSSL